MPTDTLVNLPATPMRRWSNLTRRFAAVWEWLTTAVLRRLTALATAPERGDVPGWVMVTLMTAGLVAVVWVLADDWLRQLFQQAVDRVSGH